MISANTIKDDEALQLTEDELEAIDRQVEKEYQALLAGGKEGAGVEDTLALSKILPTFAAAVSSRSSLSSMITSSG